MRLPAPYISIEGIKGSGKSLVADLLTARLQSDGIRVARLDTTSPIAGFCFMETLLRWIPALGNMDWFNERLYACRAVWHSRRALRDADIILGDRSIVTSYVTRWYKWASPGKCIRRVDSAQAAVPIPHYIIWLYCEPHMAQKRIRMRPARKYGRHDETMERLVQAHDAYYTIFSGAQPPMLKDSHWYVVNGERPADALVSQLYAFVMNQVLNHNIKTFHNHE